MGEEPADRVDLAFALREVGADSIPVNLLDPRPGTRLEGRPRMRPAEGLRALALFRFVNPARELRIAGGREAVLGPLQPLALYAANSMFTRGYLTTPGQGLEADRAMLAAAGFRVTALADG
jgi:biotin synthase